ncbi:MAG: VOC family protein [Verrucomicrobiales bacterium]
MSDENKCDQEEDKTPGLFSWRELVTQDTDASSKFYTDLFGWTADSMDMGGGNRYHMFMAGDRPVAGMVCPPGEKGSVPTNWVNYVTVENIEAALAKAQELGAHVCMPATDVPGKGRFAVITDPQGAGIALWQFV